MLNRVESAIQNYELRQLALGSLKRDEFRESLRDVLAREGIRLLSAEIGRGADGLYWVLGFKVANTVYAVNVSVAVDGTACEPEVGADVAARVLRYVRSQFTEIP